MAYHGYIPFVKQTLSNINSPKILEVGLDRGITTIPIFSFLCRVHENFEFVGVDVLFQESLLITLQNIDRMQSQKISLYQESSLNVLPRLVESSKKFDVILLDGDHNYYTVSKELSYLDDLSSENSIVIIDDYHGRWSEKDLWYSEREGYENVSQATKKIETEKRGVKPAVDEFLVSNPHWEISTLMQGEPVLLKRKQTQKSLFSMSLFNS